MPAPVLQVLSGFLAVIVLFTVFRVVMRAATDGPDADGALSAAAKPVWVVEGVADARSLHQRSWDTFNPMMPNYLPLPRSVNRKGGAQFSYTFWMKLTDTDDATVAGKVLFMRGDAKKYALQKFENAAGSAVSPLTTDNYTTQIVKAPLVRFGSTYRDVVLECNTTNDIEQRFAPTALTREQNEILAMVPGRWAMYTFVLEDNVPIDDFENGIVAKTYINDVLFHRQTARGALRQNPGPFHVLPNADLLQGAFLGNIMYVPFAMTSEEVGWLYAKGIDPKRHTKQCMMR